jgi:hypothetical protein
MGFAWSSAIAQDATLGLLRASGFPESQVLAETSPAPLAMDRLAVVATDDVIFFHRSRRCAFLDTKRYDASLKHHHVPRAAKKDVTAARATVALGCELRTSPPSVSPDAKRLQRALLAIWEVGRTQLASPAAISSILGICQWFAILARPTFCIFDQVYAFVLSQSTVVQLVPEPVRRELLLFAAIVPLLNASLSRPFFQHLGRHGCSPGVRIWCVRLPHVRLSCSSLGSQSRKAGRLCSLGQGSGPVPRGRAGPSWNPLPTSSRKKGLPSGYQLSRSFQRAQWLP